jgi:hypothetical protein
MVPSRSDLNPAPQRELHKEREQKHEADLAPAIDVRAEDLENTMLSVADCAAYAVLSRV